MARRVPASGEFYRHFKGKLYQVVTVAKDCDSLQPLVVYQALYEPYQCWARELEDFLAPVDKVKYPGVKQAYRFEQVQPGGAQEEGSMAQSMSQAAEESSRPRKVSSQKSAEESSQSGEVLSQRLAASSRPGKMPSQRSAEESSQPGEVLSQRPAESSQPGKMPFQGSVESSQPREMPSQAAAESSQPKMPAPTEEQVIKALKTGQPERYLMGRIRNEEVARIGFLGLLDAENFHEKRQIFMGLRPYLDKRMLGNIAVALDIVLEDGDEDTQFASLLWCMEKLEHYEGGRLR